MAGRNSFVEFLRFVFSILVVGYHCEESTQPDDTSFFQNGCLAVEFFFMLSGFFMAKSIEKTAKKEDMNIVVETFNFMKNKVKGILRLHIIVNIIMLVILLIWDLDNVGERLLKGIPGLFLVQNIIIWQESVELIKPEWYLSAMLICMLLIFPSAVLLRRKLHQIFVALILFGALIIVLLIYGLIANWSFEWNFQGDLRAFAEMTMGIIVLWLSNKLEKAAVSDTVAIVLKIVECVLYAVPIILGFIPLTGSLQGLCIGLTVVFSFFAVMISFAGKGIQVTGTLDKIFAYLGGISLPVYLFHPPLVALLEYTADLSMGATFPIVFFGAIALSLIEKYIHEGILYLISKATKSKNEPQKEEQPTDQVTSDANSGATQNEQITPDGEANQNEHEQITISGP